MAPTQSYRLTSAELAVLIDHMTGGRLLEGATTLPELRVDEEALAQAEESLLDQGLLLSLPFEDAAGVTSELASLLSAALTPDHVCIVRTIQQERTDPPVIFSFSAESITRNHVDRRGRHIFEELASREQAIEAIVAAGGATEAAVSRAEGGQPVAELLPTALRLVTLLSVEDPAELDAVPYSLAWLETEQGLWLVDPSSSGESPMGVSIDLPGLRRRIAEELEVAAP